MSLAPASLTAPPLRLQAAYGRLYAAGPDASRLMRLPGATRNERSGATELSLTVETMRGIRDALGLTREQLARACPPPVLAWARAAAASERLVHEVHARLGRGEFATFPWRDTGWRDAAPRCDGPRAPFDHQRTMASAAYWLDGVYFNADPGTGKTRASLEAMAQRVRDGSVDVVLVLCPRRAGKTWQDEVPCWTPDLRVERLTSGTVKARAERIERATRGTVLVLNVDVLRHCKKAIDTLTRRAKVGLIADEAHKFKNPTAERTKALLDLAPRFAARILMSGSPVLQGVQDVWSQWYGVDLGLTFGANFVQYRREFLEENPYDMSLKARAGAEVAVGQRMRRRGVRIEKSVLKDLPPKLYKTAECDLSPEQARAYEAMAETLVAELDAEAEDGRVAEASNQLVRIMRLTQITSGWVKLADGTVHAFDKNPKLDMLEEMVRELPRGTSCLVWARYNFDIDAIARRLADLHPSIIRGGMTDAESDHAQDRFQRGETRVLIGNQKAGSSSLNLQRASVAYYYSQDYSLEDRVQSEDRCHRAGSQQHNTVLYVDCAATGTIDLDVAHALTHKLNVASLVSNLRAALARS